LNLGMAFPKCMHRLPTARKVPRSRVRYSTQPPEGLFAEQQLRKKQDPTLNVNNFAKGDIRFFLELIAVRRKEKKMV